MYDYLERDEVQTPNFDNFKKKGVSSRLISVFPSLTFPNHYSIATGYHSDKHRIIGNSFFSKTLNKQYSMKDSESVQDGSFYGMEPIWVTAEKNKIRTATYFWIGSEAEINGYRPSIYKNYDGSVTFESRVDSIISWYNLPKEKRPDLAMLYFSEPDYTGHRFGTSGNEINLSIEEMDRLLEYTLDKLENLEIYDDLNIIIVSDHGMEDVSKDRVILLDKYIDVDNTQITFSPAVTHINLKNSNHIDNIKNSLKNIDNASIFSKNEIPVEYHFINNDTPDFIVVADIGWFITTSTRMKQKKRFPRGMHGYDSSYSSMHGIFLARGPSFKENISIESFENINIYPLLCSILNISPYQSNVLCNQSISNQLLVVE